jgi:hypothetical protein
VDVVNWNVNRARLHCFTCWQGMWLDGFTISKFDPTKLLTSADLLQRARTITITVGPPR